MWPGWASISGVKLPTGQAIVTGIGEDKPQAGFVPSA
ncbi:hypothetical protein N181_28165 [Sinorhizobium fredii USDA 205]|nr:hypothetical protein N181_28165 [Sinorhizobium fredii USDA 205]